MSNDICTAPACETPRGYGRALHCEKHYMRARRHGDFDTHTRRASVKYRAAHWRVARDRGRARDHQCIDCGAQAQHWSYDHTDPAERMSDTGQPYSLNVMLYDPRCSPCHATFDGTGANQYSAQT